MTQDENNSSKAPDAKRVQKIRIEGRFDLASQSHHLTVTSPDLDESESRRKLLSDIANNLKNAFSGPPRWDLFEQETKSGKAPDEILDVLASHLRLHNFRTDNEHVALLKELEKLKFSQDSLYEYYSLMFLVYEKRGEYSLAREQGQAALGIAQKLGRPDYILSSMQAVGMISLQLDQGDVEEEHRQMVQFAKQNGLEDKLAWTYHNWGSYLWSKGKYNDALALYEKETPLREKEGPGKYASHLAFLAERQDLFQPDEALKCMNALIEVEKNYPGTMGSDTLAETYYRLGRLKLRQGKAPEDYLQDALAAYEQYKKLPAMESRVAWSAGLVAIAYEALEKPDEAKHYVAIKSSFLEKYGSRVELVKEQLAQFLAGTLPPAKEREIEQFALSPEGGKIYLDWINAKALRLFQAGSFQEALDLTETAIAAIDNEGNSERNEGLSIVCHLRAMCLLNLKREPEALSSYVRALDFRPKEKALRWELCHNAMVLGAFDLAERHAKVLLSEHPTLTGAYQMLARASYYRGDLEGAQEHLLKARKFAHNKELIEKELKELAEIKRGLLNPDQAACFKKIEQRVVLPPPAEIRPSIAEYRRLPDFERLSLDQTCNYIHQIQKTPTVFVKKHRENGAALEETDFRDDLERTLSTFFRSISAETNHGKGRADLVVANLGHSFPSGVVFEFKVWGRNDYRESVAQVMKYMTDFQVLGIIFMINENKGSIASKYREQVILEDPYYVVGSFRQSPIASDTNLDHFMSRHQTPYGKEVAIFHFIFNVN